MRRLKNLFSVPQGETVTEKQLRQVLLVSVCSMLLCMGCLAGTTWALFTSTVSSENVITMGTVEIVMTAQPMDTEETAQLQDDNWTAGKYNVSVVNKGTAAGYGVITLKDTEENQTVLYTPKLAPGEDQEIEFTLILKVSCEVEVESVWENVKETEDIVQVEADKEITFGQLPEDTQEPTEPSGETEASTEITEAPTDPAEEAVTEESEETSASDPMEEPSEPTQIPEETETVGQEENAAPAEPPAEEENTEVTETESSEPESEPVSTDSETEETAAPSDAAEE